MDVFSESSVKETPSPPPVTMQAREVFNTNN